MGAVGVGTNSFTDPSVAANKLYDYSVRAYNAWGVSPSSPVAHVRTPKVVVIRKIARRNKLPASPQRAAVPPPLPADAVDRVLLRWVFDRIIW